MSETTPSQAEGAPEEEPTEPDRTTPSQAEGERDEEEDEQTSTDGGSGRP